ncbi:Sn1-specific diacylglycerol lipase beta [Seminavis robusta]|uniref:sn-1-specific diacylglycerol lipase n=1 Tax=Seminavis robusta TaxID=568900 RepID=A0A9N8EDP3_9STRA|nr:Sn1-specific diacylglycerol lipase beta [Seminavis robusta]|eukprot:Sro939_g222430.1 Sn1-specific diacylglycerol lipase beta (485) ;mRNA; f:17268-19379
MASTSSTTGSTINYRSKDVLDSRIKEMLQRVAEKTKSSLNEEELLRSCQALIGTITTKPQFRNQKLLHVERLVFEKVERPKTAHLERLLSIWLELADYAYQYHDNGMPLEAAIQELMGSTDYALVRHSTDVETGGVGYFLAIDSTQKNILIGIKGTSTSSEMITDCLATTIPHKCIPFSPFDATTSTAEEEEIGAHEGILASSIKVCNELKPILDEKIQQGYNIQIAGHSLGAGAASVVAVLLRAQFKELHAPERLHAYCFAPPPVLDHQSATKSKAFITSVVNRNDCVARMAIANVEILIRMLEGLNVAMKEAGLDDFWAIAKEAVSGEKIKQLTEEDFLQLIEIMRKAQAAVQVEHKEHLYCPGNIIALYGTLEALPAKGEEPLVTIRSGFVNPAHTFLRYFEVNDRMISDHLIPAYRESLVACIEMRKQTEVVEENGCRSYHLACCLRCLWLYEKIFCRCIGKTSRQEQMERRNDARANES